MGNRLVGICRPVSDSGVELSTGMIEKIVSGGQTGVDRAALDAAMALGIDVGGWCPRGRRAVDGIIPSRYPLLETDSQEYQVRTLWNVRDSDATLLVCSDEPDGGTALTIEYCEQLGRPYEVCQLQGGDVAVSDCSERNLIGLVRWTHSNPVNVLNVAGPREDIDCPIYARAYAFLRAFFKLAITR